MVAVEKVEPVTPGLHFPGAQVDFATGQFDRDTQPFALRIPQGHDRKEGGIVVGIDGDLLAGGVQVLTKIALLVKQSHPDQRNAQITGGLQVVTRKDSEPAGVYREGLAQPELHAHIGDAAECVIPVVLTEPAVRAR